MANDVPANDLTPAASEYTSVEAPDAAPPGRRRDTRRRAALLVVAVLAVLMAIGGIWARSELRWAEPVPYSPPPGEQTGPAPAPNATWRKDKGTFRGVVGLSGGRTGFNDRELILASGGPPPRETSPESGCGQDIVVVVVEDTPEHVVVQGQAFAGRNERRSLFDRTSWGCNAMRYQRTTTVQLPGPLAGRAVFDVGDTTVPLAIVDGSTLMVPAWLPDGYRLHGETAGTLTYSREPAEGPSSEGGVDQPGLSVSQGPTPAIIPPASADQPPVPVDELLRSLTTAGRAVTIRGEPGVIVRNSPLLPTALVWHERGEWLTISYRPGSDTDEEPSDEDLLRIGESLHLTNT